MVLRDILTRLRHPDSWKPRLAGRLKPMPSKQKSLQKYVVIPFLAASAAATLLVIMVVGGRITGYAGRNETSAVPIPFAEAWTFVPELAGMIFIVTFLVLAVWAGVRRE